MARVRKAMVAPGQKAPDFRLRSMDGAGVDLQTVCSAGAVVLAFFKVSCPVCQLTFPFLDRLKGSAKLRVIGVSQDDAAATRRFNETFGLGLETLLDEKADGYPASNGFGITQVPTVFQMEPDGTVSYAWEGFSKADMEALGQRAGAVLFRPDEYVPAWKPG